MTSTPPFEHPGAPPVRPELPAGVRRDDAPESLPRWPAWAPFAALLLTAVISLSGSLVLSVAAQLAGADLARGHVPAGVKVGGTVIQDAGLILAAIILARMTAGGVAARDFGLRAARFARSLGWMIGAWVTFLVFSGVYAALVHAPKVSDQADQLDAGDSTINLVAVTVLVTVVAPIAEEIFFRGFLFTALRRWAGWVGGAVLSGAVFAAIHVGSLDAIFLPALVVLGFLLAALYKQTGSLLPCMAFHAVNNSLAMGASQHFPALGTVALMIAASTVVVSLGLLASHSRRLNPVVAPA
jgi:membrane protease YdiL (CAAX protease family)